MSADFFSGLLLLAVVLFGAGYLIKEFFWESISAFVAAQRPQPPAGANDHLIGAAGRVVDDGTSSGRMRVRVGMESWHARLARLNQALPVGTEVEVRAVDGRVLEVVEKSAASATANR